MFNNVLSIIRYYSKWPSSFPVTSVYFKGKHNGNTLIHQTITLPTLTSLPVVQKISFERFPYRSHRYYRVLIHYKRKWSQHTQTPEVTGVSHVIYHTGTVKAHSEIIIDTKCLCVTPNFSIANKTHMSFATFPHKWYEFRCIWLWDSV